LIIVNSLELSSDDQPMKGHPGSSLRVNRRILPDPAGAAVDSAAAPVAAGEVVAPPLVPPLLDVEAVVAADAVVGVVELLPPHAANNAVIVGAANPRVAASFNIWRRVNAPELA
jgi:hypothetical protein